MRGRTVQAMRPPTTFEASAAGSHIALCDGMALSSNLRGGFDDPRANGPRLLLAEHHDAMDNACEELRVGVEIDDPLDLVTRYRAFERDVLDHLALEEELILPAYALDEPGDARRIASEHDELRRLLYQLGIEAELHCVRAESIEALIQLLKAHGRREDTRMYPWAQVHLPSSTKRQVFARVRMLLRRLSRTTEH